MSESVMHAVAGGVGGCVSMSLTYPLIVLSTRSAVRSKKSNQSALESAASILKKEGLSGLYAGLESSLVGIAATNTVFYLFLEESKRWLLARKNGPSAGKATTAEMLLASTIAGAATTVITNPIWLIQTHQATRGAVSSSDGSRTPDGKSSARPTILQSAQEIVSEKGLKGLWRGLGPALILVINPVLQYTAYDRLTQIYTAYRTRRAGGKAYKLGDRDIFLLGAVAKALATAGTYPYIVVKSRLQAATHHYKSSLRAVLEILKAEGVAGLYAGIGTKLLQSVLTASFLFVAQRRVFEMVKMLLTLRQGGLVKATA